MTENLSQWQIPSYSHIEFISNHDGLAKGDYYVESHSFENSSDATFVASYRIDGNIDKTDEDKIFFEKGIPTCFLNSTVFTSSPFEKEETADTMGMVTEKLSKREFSLQLILNMY
jgi:hypothetical protein